jgi:hypothetical protein
MARDKPVIWVKWKERYFLKQGWTRSLPDGPLGKSDIEKDDAGVSANQAAKPNRLVIACNKCEVLVQGSESDEAIQTASGEESLDCFACARSAPVQVSVTLRACSSRLKRTLERHVVERRNFTRFTRLFD